MRALILLLTLITGPAMAYSDKNAVRPASKAEEVLLEYRDTDPGAPYWRTPHGQDYTRMERMEKKKPGTGERWMKKRWGKSMDFRASPYIGPLDDELRIPWQPQYRDPFETITPQPSDLADALERAVDHEKEA